MVDIFMNSGLALLDPIMDSREARAMLIAIGLQESRFSYRVQINGPARGFWQFERGGGIRGVLSHSETMQTAIEICLRLRITPTEDECYVAITYNDALACAFARLLLWTLPDKLPQQGDPDEGWRQYIEAWRPGRPHRETWDRFFNDAWNIVTKGA
ncbi:MAG TPA: hypothetical protein PK425_08970 [Syntrophales bacterium]|nr:hypothetical protein [Syntrophales bacterium]